MKALIRAIYCVIASATPNNINFDQYKELLPGYDAIDEGVYMFGRDQAFSFDHEKRNDRLLADPAGGRQLDDLFTTSDTAKCGSDCIEKGYYFCPDSTYGSQGTCCDT